MSYFSTARAAKRLGVSSRHFLRLASDLGLEPIRDGKKRMWTLEQLDAIQERRTK